MVLLIALPPPEPSPLPPTLVVRCVRDGLKVACPDQPRCNPVLSIDNRDHLPIRAGLHAQRGKQIRFCRERIFPAAFSAHQTHTSTLVFSGVYKVIVSGESSLTPTRRFHRCYWPHFKTFVFPSQQFAIAQSIAQKNAVRNVGVDHDWPIHHDGAVGICPPKAKHNEISRLRRSV